MKYTIYEPVETVKWSDAVTMAPAELVKTAKEMNDKGDMVSFARTPDVQITYFNWCLLTVNEKGHLVIAKRDNTPISEL